MSDKFIDKAYALEGDDDARALYDAWSRSYESEVAEAGYATPGRVAEALARFAPSRDLPVLDYGCGTGLSGLALRLAGFATLDGVDISEEMMRRAREKDIYRTLTLIEPDAPLPIKPRAYSMIVACGVIGVGAAPIAVFDTIYGLLPSHGLLALSFNQHTLEKWQYTGRLNEYIDCGAFRLLFRENGPHLPALGINSDVYVLEKR